MATFSPQAQASKQPLITGIAEGETHSIALMDDGTVWTWGRNDRGQLGDGTTSDRCLPGQIPINGIVEVAAGGDMSYAVGEDGTLWAWGLSNYGDGWKDTWDTWLAPTVIPVGNVKDVAVGVGHAIVLKADGTVWTWGSNIDGQLGDGTNVGRGLPKMVPIDHVVAIAAGVDFSLALRDDGTVWAWGGENETPIGNSSHVSSSVPVMVTGLRGVTSIAAGMRHALALCENGSVFAWGYNGNGQLGDGTLETRNTPIQVPGVSNAARIYVGGMKSAAIGTDGTVWMWGDIHGPQEPAEHPSPIETPEFKGFKSFALGWGYILGLDGNGTLWGRGYNDHGQLGDGTIKDQWWPVSVVINGKRESGPLPVNSAPQATLMPQLASVKIVAIAAGEGHSMALSDDGSIWTWGWNYNGQLGDGSSTDAVIPHKVSLPGWIGQVIAGTGNRYTMALTSDGKLLAWGMNISCYGGNGPQYEQYKNIYYPSMVEGFDNVATATAGTYHAVAVLDDGSVWDWGVNSYGQLGDGTNESRPTPVKIPGLPPIIQVAAGYSHTIALDKNGHVWEWGLWDVNAYQALPKPASLDLSHLRPVEIAGLDNVKAIAAGGLSSYALKNDGTVWAWGFNNRGQLGDGSNQNRLTPVKVLNLTHVKSIMANGMFALALRNDGTVWAWGDNTYGQQGNGSSDTSIHSIPTQVSTLCNISAIACGIDHALALKADGTVWAWGDNRWGELGDGTHEAKSTPIRSMIGPTPTAETVPTPVQKDDKPASSGPCDQVLSIAVALIVVVCARLSVTSARKR